MTRTARNLLLTLVFLCAAASGLLALAVSGHSTSHPITPGHGQPAPISDASSTEQPTTAPTDPVASDSPTTTVTIAAPPATTPAPVQDVNSDPGMPAKFTLLSVSYPAYCTPGSSVVPVLKWNTANTINVAVSVDNPATVGSYGFFGTAESLTMPSIPCTGTKGDPLPSHEYEIDAFGTNNTRLHLVESINITVSPNLT
jgi:hypothetical protein